MHTDYTPSASATLPPAEREREVLSPVAMAVGAFHSVSSLVAACGRQLSRMSRKLLGSGSPRSIDDRAKIAPSWAPYLSRGVSLIPFRSGGNRKDSAAEQKKRKRRQRRAPEEEEEEDYEDAEESSGEEERRQKEKGEGEEGVWNRMILMGEKCQPLDFSGVIYYDNEGRQLPELPPRSPMRSPLPSLSFPVAAASEKSGNY